jgi:hypothetical protein
MILIFVCWGGRVSAAMIDGPPSFGRFYSIRSLSICPIYLGIPENWNDEMDGQ